MLFSFKKVQPKQADFLLINSQTHLLPNWFPTSCPHPKPQAKHRCTAMNLAKSRRF
jgi:hypothetical protein